MGKQIKDSEEKQDQKRKKDHEDKGEKMYMKDVESATATTGSGDRGMDDDKL